MLSLTVVLSRYVARHDSKSGVDLGLDQVGMETAALLRYGPLQAVPLTHLSPRKGACTAQHRLL